MPDPSLSYPGAGLVGRMFFCFVTLPRRRAGRYGATRKLMMSRAFHGFLWSARALRLTPDFAGPSVAGMVLDHAIREYYTHPARMTSPGKHAHTLHGLPRDPGELAKVVQGVLLHEHWAPAYKVELSREQRAESQIRSASHMLSQIFSHDAEPLAVAREPGKRAVGVCRHFTVLTVAMLRQLGIPARARCGFGAYFNSGKFEDHWVVELWRADEGWRLADFQLDETQLKVLQPSFAPLDVPRDQFVIAGDAWLQCRKGDADPEQFGIFDMRGMWFIGGNVRRDFAALNNMEMLPWDDWGAVTSPDRPLPQETLELLDHVAELTLDCDKRFTELRTLYGNDERLRVPPMVFNVLNKRLEDIS